LLLAPLLLLASLLLLPPLLLLLLPPLTLTPCLQAYWRNAAASK
jgi:hypothetical protein